MNKSLLVVLGSIVAFAGCQPGSAQAEPKKTSAAPGAAPAAQPAPAGVKDNAPVDKGLEVVETYTSAPDDDFVRIVGTVKNTTPFTLRGVRLDLVLRDAAGKSLDVDSITSAVAVDHGEKPHEFVYTDRVFLPPGETSTFSYLRDRKKIKGSLASHVLVPHGRVALHPPVASLSSPTITRTERGFTVKGTFQNAGPGTCHTPQIVVGLYTADGKLRASDRWSIDAWLSKDLAPRQPIPAEVSVGTFSLPEVTSAKAWADCEWDG